MTAWQNVNRRDATDATAYQRLSQCIATENERLLKTLRSYVLRMGLATYQDALAVASELLNDVVIEALQNADRYDTSREPLAWLLGIGVNLIRRRQVEFARLDRREPLARDLVDRYPDDSDGELFDRLAGLVTSAQEPGNAMETMLRTSALLAAVSPDDQIILKMAIVHGLDGDSLAQELGVSPGAARVRLHRAIRRLRLAYDSQIAEEERHED